MSISRTILLGSVLALGAPAVAATIPANAASSDGAAKTTIEYCQSGHYYTYCLTGTAVSNEVQTPGGITSTSSSGRSIYTFTSFEGEGAELTIQDSSHSHLLFSDGVLVEHHQRLKEQTTEEVGGTITYCTSLEAVHETTRGSQYHREVHGCR